MQVEKRRRIKPFCGNCGHLLSDHSTGGWCTRCEYNAFVKHRERHPDITMENCECNCCEDLTNCYQVEEIESEY